MKLRQAMKIITKNGLALIALVFFSSMTLAEDKFGIPAVTLVTEPDGSGRYSVTIQILAIMSLLTILPTLIIMMTSFTRIIVVFAILRQALGLQQTPSNQVLLGMSLFLSIFIMAPIYEQINERAIEPYLSEQVTSLEALDLAKEPMKAFMLSQVRLKDLETFAKIAGYDQLDSPEATPLIVLIPAFVTSELQTAFIIGFMFFIPFLIVDLVVASVLMAMGMMMLSPMIVSLPFKIMLFVLVDGWSLVMGTLAKSFGLGT